MCVCVFIKLHITAQSGLVILVIILSCHFCNTMFDGVLHCLCFVFTVVFFVSLHDD